MNRFRKALSMNRDYSNNPAEEEGETPTTVKKRFSLFNSNSKRSKSENVLDLSRLNISEPSILVDNFESTNARSDMYNNNRPQSAYFASAAEDNNNNSSFTSSSLSSSVATNSFTSNNQNQLTNKQSLQSFQSTDIVGSVVPPVPRRRSHKVIKAAGAHMVEEEQQVDQSLLEDADYLQLGMKYHEKGELEKATHYWRLSAENGSPLGLFFYGIALRHGWGCKKNSAKAVRYLQKAAESAVHDLQTGIAQSASVAKSELVLAIYELGVCFRHGWGVPKNLETATYYFQVASNLGDPDAQNDLGFCYSQGLGVKKDLYCSAKYYRLAEKQGQGIIGNSWIWKEKYNQVEEPGWNGQRKK